MHRFLLFVVPVAKGGCPFLAANDNSDMPCPHAPKLRSAPLIPEPVPHARSLQSQYGPPLRSQSEVSGSGCKCISECGASILGTPNSAGLGSCDWCWTEGECGTWSPRGHWDYCAYPQMGAFEQQTYGAKEHQLWSLLIDPAVVGRSQPAKSTLTSVTQVLGESVITTFDNQREVMPAGRTKVIHVQGAHCMFDLDVDPYSPYTGLFSPGIRSGFIRMGSATNVDSALFPGMGIKFLRSGIRSADFVALRSTGPGGSNNFFDSMFSNHVAPSGALIKSGKFQQASGCINAVGLSDVCSYNQNGYASSKIKFPFEIMFFPTGKVNFQDVKKTNEDLMRELSSISAGTHLFDVWTYDSPAAKAENRMTRLGTVTTKTACQQSLFGDQQMFFRHQRMEEDFAIEQGWIEQMHQLGFVNEACNPTAGPISQWQCTPVPSWYTPGS